jgi:hypothetical protein
MARARSAADAPAPARPVWSRLAVLVFLLPAAAVLLPSTILLSVLMLPTLCAWIVDRVPGRSLALSIGLLNGAGTIPGMVQLWSGGHDLPTMSRVLGDPYVWFAAYLAAGAAWLIFLMLPPLLQRYYAFASDSRLRGLQKRQEKLRAEWGQEVAGLTPEGQAEAEGDAPAAGRAKPAQNRAQKPGGQTATA